MVQRGSKERRQSPSLTDHLASLKPFSRRKGRVDSLYVYSPHLIIGFFAHLPLARISYVFEQAGVELLLSTSQTDRELTGRVEGRWGRGSEEKITFSH
jgi:hypothetical protein